MKKLLFIFFLLNMNTYAQTKQVKFDNFIQYVSSHIKADKYFTDNCAWQYSLVKAICNTENQVESYSIMNSVDTEIKNRFKFLKGYQFSKKVNLKRCPIIFLVTFENHSTDCILKDKTIGEEGSKEVFSLVTQQINKEPSSIFINNILVVSYKYDPEP